MRSPRKELRLRQLLIFVFALVVCVWLDGANAGKTLKLPHYRVKFGSWPLMEVTRTGRILKLGRGRGLRNLGGKGGRFPLRLKGGGHGGHKHGSHPPPGKLSQLKENRGTIHKHLQETLKMYAQTNLKPLNLQSLPIIVKAPGPHPPAAPPGYKLGPPSVANPDSGLWKPGPSPFTAAASGANEGPPVLFAGGHDDISSKGNFKGGGRLVSMMQNAAYSGIFKNTVDTFVAPDFNNGPPPSGTYASVLPDGSLVETLVGDDFRPVPRNPTPVEAKPSIPPVLHVGGPLPENYTLKYATRHVVSIKAPDPFEKSGNTHPGVSEYEVGVDLGKVYEQGYGAKPPPSHPIEITKFQKRGDYKKEVPVKIVEQELPDSGLIMTTNVVYSTPNISAPLGGRTSEPFKEALREKWKVQYKRSHEKPLDAQVKLLGRLFTKLQRLEPPKLAVPESEAEEGKYTDVGGGWGEPDAEGEWKYVAKSKVDSPVMAIQVQTWSAPEINSSDPDIVESMAEFGAHDVKFTDSDEIVHLMQIALNKGSSRIEVRDLGSNPDEINDNMLNWVRRHLTIVREINGDAHRKGEVIASNQFKQYQQIVTPPVGQNGWGPGEALPYDPKKGSRSFSESASVAVSKFEGPPPLRL